MTSTGGHLPGCVWCVIPGGCCRIRRSEQWAGLFGAGGPPAETSMSRTPAVSPTGARGWPQLGVTSRLHLARNTGLTAGTECSPRQQLAAAGSPVTHPTPPPSPPPSTPPPLPAAGATGAAAAAAAGDGRPFVGLFFLLICLLVVASLATLSSVLSILSLLSPLFSLSSTTPERQHPVAQ